MKGQFWRTKNIALMGIFGTLSAVLMLFEVPLLFIAPSFYKLDFSEIPIMIGTFALGPWAGAVMEVLIIKPTSTAFVGEFANLVIGWAMVVPAGIIYEHRKMKKTAVKGMIIGTISMTAVGIAVNALVMLPFYSGFMPLEQIIAAGSKIVPAVHSVWTFALFCVGPFNLFKGLVILLVTMLVYKRVSYLIRQFQADKKEKKK